MIKTFEEFVNEAAVPHTPEIVYTPEEYKTAYDIVSQYYDGDVDEFLYSTNIEEKVDFILENVNDLARPVTSGQGYSVRYKKKINNIC